jgi:NTP pyrophosphatase (non-canonical NTP hydrolase)
MNEEVIELIRWIKHKIRYDLEEDKKEIMNEIKDMNILELTKWAIRNDIIDA